MAGMVAGADSISDMDLLRHGAMSRLFAGVRAPSTLGTFLRAFRVRSRAATGRGRGPGAGRAGRRSSDVCRGATRSTYLDVDDTVRATYGYAKQGAGYGYTGVKGLNALLATAVDRAVVGAGDRRDPAAEGVGELRPRRRPAGRRRDQDQPGVRA